MRVLVVDPSSRGGIPAYTMLLARSLSAAGADVAILGSRELEPTGGEVRLVRRLPADRWGRPRHAGPAFYLRRARTWIRSALVIRSEIARERPDVVHFQMPVNRRLDALLLRRLARREALVWTAHDVLPFERSERDRRRFGSIYRAVDRVIVHTPAAAGELRALAGVDPVVIEHPVPSPTRTPRAEARRRLGLALEGRLLCALGFIRSYKGYGLLAEVWERLGERAPRLLVMGELFDERERPVLERLARHRQVEIRLGYAGDADLQLAACAADALLLPYASASDSGFVHLARALGVPVLASDAPQLASSVSATRAGAVIARDADSWARAVVAELPEPPPPPPPPEAVGASHLALYDDVLERRLPRRPFRLVLYTDAVERGGAEGVLAELAANLDERIDIVVMGVDEGLVRWLAGHRLSARTCIVPPVRNKRDLGPIVAHWRALRRLRPDVFHANLRHPWSCQYGLLAALLTRRTKVLALEHCPTPPTARLQLLLKRLSSRRLDAHVAVGIRAARGLEEMIGLRRRSIRTIHNGVRGMAAARAGGTTARTLAAMGRLDRQKGYDVLLRALVELPETRAVIAGDGPERETLEQLARELGVAGRAEFRGWLDETGPLLRSSRALVLPSRFEALPLTVLEAMQAGLPVVASDVGSVREAVIDGETGLLVPPDDVPALVAAIRSVLDPVRAAAMGQRARAVAARRFTTERMVREYELLYRRLLA
jgi:glycosyltransferase involved in cell wall biosynthesis